MRVNINAYVYYLDYIGISYAKSFSLDKLLF